jgi:hypothetical protein
MSRLTTFVNRTALNISECLVTECSQFRFRRSAEHFRGFSSTEGRFRFGDLPSTVFVLPNGTSYLRYPLF